MKFDTLEWMQFCESYIFVPFIIVAFYWIFMALGVLFMVCAVSLTV